MRTLPAFFIFLVISLVLGGYSLSFAQEQTQERTADPQMILTWQAQSYVPAGFQGKVLPTAKSPIVASVSLIDAASGRLIDLSEQKIYWYLNGNFFKGDRGLQQVSFRAPDIIPATTKLRAQLPDFEGSVIVKTAEIPIVSPEAVIEAPFPHNKFSTSVISLQSNLYFWDVVSPADLDYSWSINGEIAPNEKANTLGVNIISGTPSGYYLSIGLTVSNPRSTTLFGKNATTNLNLKFVQ